MSLRPGDGIGNWYVCAIIGYDLYECRCSCGKLHKLTEAKVLRGFKCSCRTPSPIKVGKKPTKRGRTYQHIYKVFSYKKGYYVEGSRLFYKGRCVPREHVYAAVAVYTGRLSLTGDEIIFSPANLKLLYAALLTRLRIDATKETTLFIS